MKYQNIIDNMTLKEKAGLSLRASTPADTLLDRLSRLWN